VNYAAVPLADLASPKRYAFVGGPFGSKLTSADYVAEGIPVIRGANLTAGRYLNEKDFVFVSEQKMREDLFGNLAHPGDIVFTQRGTLGQVSLIPENAEFGAYVISQSQMKLSVDSSKADVRFIYYWFSSSQTVEKIISQNSSSGVPHINLTVLRNFKVPVPPLREQHRIADILSAYDDLIENNRRRIALLEEAARILYREWFVYFRFPGDEHVKIVDSIPDGWERRKLGSIVTLKRGYDLPEAKRVAGPFPIVSSSGITGFHTDHKAVGPGVVTGRYGTLGQVYYVEGGYWPLNTALYVKDFQGSHPLIVFHLLKTLLKGIIAEKAAVPGLDRNVLHTMLVTWPPEKLRHLFVEVVADHQSQVKVLEAMNEKLALARDLLLPRLMSGKMPV
jgi:type I restriction enzyme, S subunit